MRLFYCFYSILLYELNYQYWQWRRLRQTKCFNSLLMKKKNDSCRNVQEIWNLREIFNLPLSCILFKDSQIQHSTFWCVFFSGRNHAVERKERKITTLWLKFQVLRISQTLISFLTVARVSPHSNHFLARLLRKMERQQKRARRGRGGNEIFFSFPSFPFFSTLVLAFATNSYRNTC